ncbi:MAG: hypothetical protein MR779_00030 [Tenericutes bacterium]|nr:hypothetical protein [Mycoplasmatota bacterium]
MKLNDLLNLYKGTNVEAPETVGLVGTYSMSNAMLDCNCIDCGADADCSIRD